MTTAGYCCRYRAGCRERGVHDINFSQTRKEALSNDDTLELVSCSMYDFQQDRTYIFFNFTNIRVWKANIFW